MKSIIATLTLLITLACSLGLNAQEQEYNFKDPKAVNAIQFELDSEIEPFCGIASDVSGKISYDPAQPKKIKGSIMVTAKSVTMSNPTMTDVLHTAEWLEVEKYSQITFVLKKVKSAEVSKDKKSTSLKIVGEMQIHGVKKELETTIVVSYLPKMLKLRNHSEVDGDLLKIKSSFSILRSDFGVGAQMPQVSDRIDLRMSIIGCCPKPNAKK